MIKSPYQNFYSVLVITWLCALSFSTNAANQKTIAQQKRCDGTLAVKPTTEPAQGLLNKIEPSILNAIKYLLSDGTKGKSHGALLQNNSSIQTPINSLESLKLQKTTYLGQWQLTDLGEPSQHYVFAIEDHIGRHYALRFSAKTAGQKTMVQLHSVVMLDQTATAQDAFIGLGTQFTPLLGITSGTHEIADQMFFEMFGRRDDGQNVARVRFFYKNSQIHDGPIDLELTTRSNDVVTFSGIINDHSLMSRKITMKWYLGKNKIDVQIEENVGPRVLSVETSNETLSFSASP